MVGANVWKGGYLQYSMDTHQKTGSFEANIEEDSYVGKLNTYTHIYINTNSNCTSCTCTAPLQMCVLSVVKLLILLLFKKQYQSEKVSIMFLQMS